MLQIQQLLLNLSSEIWIGEGTQHMASIWSFIDYTLGQALSFDDSSLKCIVDCVFD